jgi:hypothetical protein
MTATQAQHIGWTDAQRRDSANQIKREVEAALSALEVVPGENSWLKGVTLLGGSAIQVQLSVTTDNLEPEQLHAIGEVFRIASRWSDTSVVIQPAGDRQITDTLDLRGQAFADRGPHDQD